MPKPNVYDLIDLLTAIAIENRCATPERSINSIRFGMFLSFAGPLGILGNLASVLSIADHWRIDPITGDHRKDVFWVTLINSFALVFGCLSNILLAFNRTTLWLVSLSYFIALILYCSLMAAVQYVYFHNTDYIRSSGYWHAVAASCFYFIAAVLSGAHAVYVYRNKIRASFAAKFKRLELLCVLYIAFIAIGSAVFSARAMLNLPYSDAVYFAIVTCLTIGYGDIVPETPLTRALDIPYVYGGLILGGLVAYAIFSIGLETARCSSAVLTVEEKRLRIDQEFTNPEDSYMVMRKLVTSSTSWLNLRRAAYTTTSLAGYWLLGALVFKYTEGWTYFDGFYFCSIALSSVGYGDLTPESAAGKTFVVYWALMMAPGVTIALTDVYVLLYSFVTAKDLFIEEKIRKIRKHKHVHKPRYHHFDYDESESQDSWDLVFKILNAKCYGYRLWEPCMAKLFYPNPVPADFWVSEHSPIRNPALNERKFLLMACSHTISDFSKIEKYED